MNLRESLENKIAIRDLISKEIKSVKNHLAVIESHYDCGDVLINRFGHKAVVEGFRFNDNQEHHDILIRKIKSSGEPYQNACHLSYYQAKDWKIFSSKNKENLKTN